MASKARTYSATLTACTETFCKALGMFTENQVALTEGADPPYRIDHAAQVRSYAQTFERFYHFAAHGIQADIVDDHIQQVTDLQRAGLYSSGHRRQGFVYVLAQHRPLLPCSGRLLPGSGSRRCTKPPRCGCHWLA